MRIEQKLWIFNSNQFLNQSQIFKISLYLFYFLNMCVRIEIFWATTCCLLYYCQIQVFHFLQAEKTDKCSKMWWNLVMGLWSSSLFDSNKPTCVIMRRSRRLRRMICLGIILQRRKRFLSRGFRLHNYEFSTHK